MSIFIGIFREVVGLERGSLSLVSTIEELLERTSSGSSLENREYRRRDPSRRPHGALYPEKLALTSPTSSLADLGHGVLAFYADRLMHYFNEARETR
jgi:hypothetical protein